VREADVVDVIRSHAASFDAILLDVDNGPEGLIRKANDALYDPKGLKTIHRALRPRGVLAVWSSGPNPAFTKRLRDAGFEVDEVALRATARRSGARHVIWFATKSEGSR
jgi:spermidine synthase